MLTAVEAPVAEAIAAPAYSGLGRVIAGGDISVAAPPAAETLAESPETDSSVVCGSDFGRPPAKHLSLLHRGSYDQQHFYTTEVFINRSEAAAEEGPFAE